MRLKIVSIQTSTSSNKNFFLEFVWFAIITCSICDTSAFLFFSLSRHYLLQGTIKTLSLLFHPENPFEHENITMLSMVSMVSSLVISKLHAAFGLLLVHCGAL